MTLTPEQIREEVELAGWPWDNNTLTGRSFFALPNSQREDDIGVSERWVEHDNPVGLAALASQLISQVDALEPELSITATAKYIHLSGPQGHILTIDGPNRDENSILACCEFLRDKGDE